MTWALELGQLGDLTQELSVMTWDLTWDLDSGLVMSGLDLVLSVTLCNDKLSLLLYGDSRFVTWDLTWDM